MKIKKLYILIFEVIIILIFIALIGNKFIYKEKNTISEITECKCQIVNVYEIDNGFYNIIVKTDCDEVYSMKIESGFYNDISNDDNYHKCRIIKKYYRDKLYSTNVFLIF